MSVAGRVLERIPRPTGAGMFYLLICGLVFAQSTREQTPESQNLLILVGAAVGGLVITGAALGLGTLARVSLVRKPPPTAEVGQPVAVMSEVTNRSRWLPAGMVEVHQPETPGVGFRHSADIAVYCKPGGTHRVEHTAVFLRRGDQQLGDMRLSCAFPFGLVRHWRRVKLRNTVLVWPRRTPVPGWLMQRILSASLGMQTSSRHRGSDEIYGLREYAPGDPVARIHWATSARAGTPMLLEMDGLAGQRCMVLVDTGEDGAGPREDMDAQAAADTRRGGNPALRDLESLVSVAAGLVSELHRSGRPVGLTLMDGGTVRSLPALQSTAGFHQAMGLLARCQAAQVPLEEWAPETVAALPTSTLCVLVTARAPDAVPPMLLRGRGGCVLVSLRDPMVQSAVEAGRAPARVRRHGGEAGDSARLAAVAARDAEDSP